MSKGKALGDILSQAKDMKFLHNTSESAIRNYEQIGGMPMPSIGVTRDDVSFDNFGDITLVGRPEMFDPSFKPNKIYGADAYTVRSPRPVMAVDKSKLKEFDKKGGFFDQVADLGGYTDEARSKAYALAKKSGVSEGNFNSVDEFFDRDYGVTALFLKENGLPIPYEPNGKIDKFALSRLASDYAPMKKKWVENKKTQLFSNEKYFVANPDRDYVTQSPKLVPYTAENITKFMKKYAGTAKEGGVFSSGGGANRAATLSPMKSLDEVRSRKGAITNKEGVEAAAAEADLLLSDLKNKISPSYKYSSGIDDDINNALSLSSRKSISFALKDAGFENPTSEAVDAFRAYKQKLESMPTEYFESKPERTVSLNEFGAAIIPENTSDDMIKYLEGRGIESHKYKTPEERLAIRKSLGQYAFQVAPVGVGLGGSFLTPDQTMAQQIANTPFRQPSIGEVLASGAPTAYARAPESQTLLNVAEAAQKWSDWRDKNLPAPVNFLLPGQPDPDYLRNRAYGREPTTWEKIKFGLSFL